MPKTSKTLLLALLKVLSAIFLVQYVASAMFATPDISGLIVASGFAFTSIDWDGGDNIGGFTSEAFLGIYNDIDTWPALPENPTTDQDLVTLAGNYAMKPDKNFIRIYVTAKTFGGEAENQGEIDGKSFLQKGTFFYPGTREQALAFARKINNARGVLIGIDPNTGKQIQFGSKEFPCYFKPKIEFGNEPTSRRGLTVEFEADNIVPALVYPGTIPLSGATPP